MIRELFDGWTALDFSLLFVLVAFGVAVIIATHKSIRDERRR